MGPKLPLALAWQRLRALGVFFFKPLYGYKLFIWPSDLELWQSLVEHLVVRPKEVAQQRARALGSMDREKRRRARARFEADGASAQVSDHGAR